MKESKETIHGLRKKSDSRTSCRSEFSFIQRHTTLSGRRNAKEKRAIQTSLLHFGFGAASDDAKRKGGQIKRVSSPWGTGRKNVKKTGVEGRIQHGTNCRTF